MGLPSEVIIVTVTLLLACTATFPGLQVEALPFPGATTSLMLTPEALPLESEPVQAKTPAPAMVPVSSTVIPVSNVKQPSPRQAGQAVYYPRRFRFFDKSSKPDAPIRLITKNTNLKTVYSSKDT